MNIHWLKLLPTACKVVSWLTRRKPTRCTVLIVEDNANDAELLADKIRKCGHDSEVVTSGDMALGVVKHSFYPLAFVDLRLPGMSGKAVLRLLSKESPRTRRVIVCGERHDVPDAIDPGVALVTIIKPATLEAVMEVFEMFLSERK